MANKETSRPHRRASGLLLVLLWAALGLCWQAPAVAQKHALNREDVNRCNPLLGGATLNQTTLSAAIATCNTQLGTSYILLLTPGTWTIGANLTIPSTVGVDVPQGALFSVSSGVTLTLDCTKMWAGHWQVFSGSGSLACSTGGGQLSAAWFGTALTGATLSLASTMTSGNIDLVIPPGTWTISSNLTLPTRLAYEMPYGTVLSVNTTITLTLDCAKIRAGSYQIFDGAGTVSCSGVPPGGFPVTWAGALADSTTDNLTAFNRARTAVCGATTGGRAVYIPPGDSGYYALSAAWVITGCSGFHISGAGERSQLVATGTDDIIRLSSNNGYTIRDIGLSGEIGSRDGIRIGTANSPQANPSHYGHIENVYCNGVDGNCISNLSGILTTILRPKFTVNYGPVFSVTGKGTTKIGIYIPDNSSGFNNGFAIISPLIEGMGTHGVDVGGGMSGGYIGGGTVEGNGNRAGSTGNATHANIRSAGHTTLFIGDGIFLEQNTDVERNLILTGCISCTIDTLTAGTNTVSPRGDIELTGANGAVLRNVYTNQITLDSTSIDNELDGVTVGTQVGGTVTNNGVRTKLTRIKNSSNENFKPGGLRLDSPINLATNPSFEWWTSPTALQNWTAVNGVPTRIGTGEATTDRQCGRYAVRLTPTAGQGTVYLGLRITDTPEAAPPDTRYEHARLIGQPITVTFFAKRAAGTQPGTMRWAYDAGGSLFTQGLIGISTSWQQFKFTSLVPTGTGSLDIQIASNQGVVDNAMVLDIDCLTVTVGETASTPAYDNVGRPGEGVQRATFSATPTFYADAADFHRIIMTANITSVTISNGRLGQEMCVLWQQDGTGGRTVTGFAAAIELTGGAITPTAGANKGTMQCFRYDGVSWWETSRALDLN